MSAITEPTVLRIMFKIGCMAHRDLEVMTNVIKAESYYDLAIKYKEYLASLALSRGPAAQKPRQGKGSVNKKDRDGAAYKQQSKTKLKCEHCGKQGHTKTRCWELHPELKPEKLKQQDKKNVDEATQ